MKKTINTRLFSVILASLIALFVLAVINNYNNDVTQTNTQHSYKQWVKYSKNSVLEFKDVTITYQGLKKVKTSVYGGKDIIEEYVVFSAAYIDNYYSTGKKVTTEINFSEKSKDNFYLLTLDRRRGLSVYFKKDSADQGSILVEETKIGSEYGEITDLDRIGDTIEYPDFTIILKDVVNGDLSDKTLPKLNFVLRSPSLPPNIKDPDEISLVIENGSADFNYKLKKYKISFPKGVPPYTMTSSTEYKISLVVDSLLDS